MMKLASRRDMIAAGCMTSIAAFVAACTVTSDNGKTTITIDTAKVDTDGTAILTALGAILASPAVIALLGANAVVAGGALVAAKAALAEFDGITHGAINLTYDSTKAIAAVNSLINNAQTILQIVQSMAAQLPGTASTAVGNYVSAILTLIPFLQVAVGLVSTPKAANILMTEDEAIRIATH